MNVNVNFMSNTGVLAQSPEPEAHDKVLDNSRLNRNLEMVVFEERGKPEYPEQGRATNNKLNPHMTPGPGIEPGTHWWEASALTTVPSRVLFDIFLR